METTPSIDSTPNPTSPQVENSHSTNEITTNNEDLSDLQGFISAPTPNVIESIDNCLPVVTPILSEETVPTQVRQSEFVIEETSQFRIGRTTADQESTTTIGVSIQESSVTTIFTKRSKAKKKAMQYRIHCPDKPKTTNELNLPKGSTEFDYHRESIPIDTKDLCDIHKISRGEFGQVFSVVTKSSNATPIAVKRIPSHQVKISEVEIMREVCAGENQYIIDYYCALFDNDEKYLYICMEYMDTSIDAFYRTMHQQSRLEFDQVEQFIERVTHDVVCGLTYMERKEILHRDIKPANLLINKESYVKLCDFGISRSFSRMNLYFNNLNDDDFCALSPLLNTENYMPLTIRGKIQDDMWALGITLLEIVTGRNPFLHWKPNERFTQLLQWEPSIPPIISNEMQQLILHLLKKEPCDRPSSYNDILNECPICEVSDVPTSNECRFVCSIIDIISQEIQHR